MPTGHKVFDIIVYAVAACLGALVAGVFLLLQIKQQARDPRCYAVDDPVTFPDGDDWPELCCSSSFTPWNMGACSEPKDWLLDHAFEEPLRELVRKMRGESDGHVPLRISVPDDPITTAAVTPGWCRDANGWASIDSDPYSRPKATP